MEVSWHGVPMGPAKSSILFSEFLWNKLPSSYCLCSPTWSMEIKHLRTGLGPRSPHNKTHVAPMQSVVLFGTAEASGIKTLSGVSSLRDQWPSAIGNLRHGYMENSTFLYVSVFARASRRFALCLPSYSWCTHEKWRCSIVLLVDQRVRQQEFCYHMLSQYGAFVG